MGFDAAAFRDVLGRFATGIAVVTTADPRADQAPLGVTINSFTSVSLEPPLVLFCLRRHSHTHPAFQAAPHFVVNFLASSQESISNQFTKPSAVDWNSLAWRRNDQGAPVLEGSLGHLECRSYSRHESGDHTIYVGEVLTIGSNEGEPLLYYRGRYARLASGA